MRARVLLVTMAFSRGKEEKCKFWEVIVVCTYCGDGVGDVEAWKKEMGKMDQYHEIEVS